MKGTAVWSELVGQAKAASELKRAAADARLDPPGPAMTHAWLITGPPGSGRSVAATAFAAALVCPRGGCGTCQQCVMVAAGSHPDVELVRPEGVSYRTGDTRALVAKASIAPAESRWHVVVLEDADRLTESANNVLLKSIEEPTPRTVWVLCAPSVTDVLPTIRSRCQVIALRTPSAPEVAEYLSQAHGVDPGTALFAARASQGHVGRARALAEDEPTRQRRSEVLGLAGRLTDLATCLTAASDVVAAARSDALALTNPVDEKERSDLLVAWGEGAQGRGVSGGARGVKGALKDLEEHQSSRRSRVQRDQLDRALLDLLGLYRDVLAVQIGADQPGPGQPGIDLINSELESEINRLASASEPYSTMLRLEAIERARLALAANVAPLLALEALTVDLRNPRLRATLT